MAGAHLNPMPPPATRWIDPPGSPAVAFRQYFLSLDLVVRGLNAFFGAAIFPTSQPAAPPGLVNAANDAAAATAGVPIGGFYRNGSVVMIRVT